jgi:hypothetical protein
MRVALFITLVMFVSGCTQSSSDTTADMWSSYTDAPSGEKHCMFDLRYFKKGLLLGICPTTRQLQWSYHFDLVGDGPKYRPEQLKVTDTSDENVKVVSGQVLIDHNTAMIDIQIEQAGTTNEFLANGTYLLHGTQ